MLRFVVEVAVRVTVLGVLLQLGKSVWLRVMTDSRLLESLSVTGPVPGLQVKVMVWLMLPGVVKLRSRCVMVVPLLCQVTLGVGLPLTMPTTRV
jgi:hypothetical protein